MKNKEYHKLYMREYGRKNADRINARRRELRNASPELYKARRKQTEAKNTGLYKEIKRRGHLVEAEKYKDNPQYREKVCIRTSIWKKKNPGKYREISRRSWAKKKNRPETKLNTCMKLGIGRSLRGNVGRRWKSYVNYTIEELKEHLESQFQSGMSWDNRGNWQIDHKIPISWWRYSSPRDGEFKQCWALANLRPLWAKENSSKGNRIVAVE